MRQNKLTVFLTTYNRAVYLKEAILSVINQSFKNFRLIILDNCSTDNTEKLIETFLEDERVKYIKHEKNMGGRWNINYAFEHCDTEYFCVFHDDDILHSNLLEREVAFMEQNPDCAAVSCMANDIDGKGQLIKVTNTKDNNAVKFIKDAFFKEYFYRQKHLIFPTMMYRNSFMKEHGIKLNFDVGPCADIVLYMEIERYGGIIAELNEVMFDYRIYPNQASYINLENMLLQLIHFLKNDSYYSALMNINHSGRNRYFRWYASRLVTRVASKAISADKAAAFLQEMKEKLNTSDLFFPLVSTLIFIEKVIPLPFNKIYTMKKRLKMTLRNKK